MAKSKARKTTAANKKKPRRAAPKKTARKKATPKKASPKKASPKRASPKQPARTKLAPKVPVPKDAPRNAVTAEAAEQDASPPEHAERYVVATRIVEPPPALHRERPAHISEAAPRVALPSAGSPTGAPALAGTALTWRDALRAAIPTSGPDFATYLRSLGSETPWTYADTPELVGLERWGRELAQRDRIAGIGALVVGAQLTGTTSNDDPVARAIAWLDAPGPLTEEQVDDAFDRTQRSSAPDDLGQCCCAAILDVGSDPNGETYYEWPTPTCVGRGLVMAARGSRGPHDGIAAVVNRLGAAMAA